MGEKWKDIDNSLILIYDINIFMTEIDEAHIILNSNGSIATIEILSAD